MPASHSIGKAFRGYEPAIDLFPVELWARIAARVYRKAPRSLYGQGDAGGYPPLRRAIAEYVGHSRGVRCSAEQVIVTSGAQQALDLLARVLLDPGDEVWMEDPGYPGASQAFQNGGANVIPIPVDGDGIDVARAIKSSPAGRVVYVTPANQFSLGTVMSAERRVELLSWATRAGAWIIEDEYDAEYRYSGKPIASLHSLDRSGSVIYVGTFTKMLFNALRIGFIVVPERLVEAFRTARSFIDRHAPTLDQAVLTEFINEGHFGHHVRKMRQIYSDRSQLLSEEANRRLSGLLDVQHAQSGMRTVAWIKTRITEMVLTRRAEQVGLEVVPISSYVSKYEQKPALMLGFAGCNAGEIKRGVSVFEKIGGLGERIEQTLQFLTEGFFPPPSGLVVVQASSGSALNAKSSSPGIKGILWASWKPACCSWLMSSGLLGSLPSVLEVGSLANGDSRLNRSVTLWARAFILLEDRYLKKLEVGSRTRGRRARINGDADRWRETEKN